jgi:hypothetical protein
MESVNHDPVNCGTNEEPLLSERMPGKSFGEYCGLAALFVLAINGFVLVTTYAKFARGDLGIPIAVHLLVSSAVLLLFLHGWKLIRSEQSLVVRSDALEFTSGGTTKQVPRHGSEIRLSISRTSSSDSCRVLVIRDEKQFPLPEELTGSPEAFCTLLEAHGWRVVWPVGWNGRLY